MLTNFDALSDVLSHLINCNNVAINCTPTH